MLKDKILQPPLEAAGKSLISIVIYVDELAESTFLGMGGYKGNEASVTPKIGLSM